MNFEALVVTYGLYAAGFIVGLVSGFVPFINIEVFLVAIAAIPASDVPTRAGLLLIVVASTVGHMVAKVIIFYAGRGVVKIPFRKSHREKMERVRDQLDNARGRTGLLILASGAVGFPPFYLVSILAGAMRIKFVEFLIAGFLGRLIRFASFAFFPQFFKGIL